MNPTRSAAILTTLALLGLAPGCARTIIENPLAVNYPAGDFEGDLNFWHTLPERSAVSNDEGLHGIFLMADGDDKFTSWEARVEEAKTRGYLSDGWAEPANLSMRRGTLARCVAVCCKVKGGVMMQLFGPIDRYAIRELVYMRIMGDPSTEAQSITGLEYIGVISKAQDYINLNQAPPPPAAPLDEPQDPRELRPRGMENEPVTPPATPPPAP